MHRKLWPKYLCIVSLEAYVEVGSRWEEIKVHDQQMYNEHIATRHLSSKDFYSDILIVLVMPPPERR